MELTVECTTVKMHYDIAIERKILDIQNSK